MIQIMQVVLTITGVLLFTLPARAENARIIPGSPKKLLFVGSSLTVNGGGIHNYFNELDKASAAPENFIIEREIKGGYNIGAHWADGDMQPRIEAGDYDDTATLQPLYLRRPPITERKHR